MYYIVIRSTNDVLEECLSLSWARNRIYEMVENDKIEFPDFSDNTSQYYSIIDNEGNVLF